MVRQNKPRRKSIRLLGHDYSAPGAYFFTACTRHRLPLFGRVVAGEIAANRLGAAVEDCWTKLPDHYDNIALDAFTLMPNHVHGLIIIVGAGFKPAPTGRHGAAEIVRAFKTFSARRINELRASPGAPVWQRGFYDRIIRSGDELNRARAYIENNPRMWSEDADNPANRRM